MWNGPSVSVYSYATPTPATPSLSVTGLSDRGQAAWIEALAKSHADATKLGAILSKPIGKTDDDTEGAATHDETFSRTLVATVAEGLNAGPADRLVWTWVDIRPDNFSFDGYTIAATDNEQLTVETVQNQSTASLQGQARNDDVEHQRRLDVDCTAVGHWRHDDGRRSDQGLRDLGGAHRKPEQSVHDRRHDQSTI